MSGYHSPDSEGMHFHVSGYFIYQVGQLRSNGVTLHMPLKSDRLAVPDVPVIYFIEPSEDSISRVVSDYRAGLYSYMHLNFSSSIPSKLLEKFAQDISRITPPSATQISRVIDRHCAFVSLDETMYSLNLSSSYFRLHQPGVSDQEIETLIGGISSGLLSLILTCIKQVPVIRAPQNAAAGMIAQSLHERIIELLGSGAVNDLFSSTASVSTDPTHAQRPLLVILDRDIDLSPLIAHGWSYASLMTDLLGMNLNKVSIPKENKHYDIDPSDPFWKRIGHLPFPDAATAVNEQVNEFSRKRGEVTEADGSLHTAMSALPQITELKKAVDMHTTIATALLNIIKARGIDRYYEVESDLNLNTLSSLLTAEAKVPESVMDKVRTALVVVLKKEGIQSSKIDQIIAQIGHDESVNALKYIRYLLGLRSVPTAPQLAPQTSNPGGPVLPGVLGGLAEKMKSHGEGLLAAGMKNLKNIIPINGNLVATNTVGQLADQVMNPVTDSFMYLDPKNPHSTVRVRGSFRQVVVCVIGGGSILECENLMAWSSKSGRTCVYGATDFPSPNQFVKDLAKLGAKH
jgi:hypothetical protein